MTDQERTTRALIGFMDEQDAMSFLKGTGISEGRTDKELRGVWKKARAASEELPSPHLTPDVVDLDPQYAERLKRIATDPLFPEAVQQKKWSFKLVEIDKLVCFQKFIYSDYAESMVKGYDLTDHSKLIEFCLSEAASKKPIAISSTTQEFTILSPSQDLRVVGLTQMQDPATKRRIFGFAVGWGLPFIQVVKFNDRYFLRNGYHRVYALRRAGSKYVVCVLIEAERFSDVGILPTGFFGEQLLMSSKPPTFADFLSDEIALLVRLKPLTKVVRVRAEEAILPVVLPTSSFHREEVSSETSEEKHGQPQFEDFTIQREDWNIYRLSDNSTLKLRQVLIRVDKDAQGDPGQPNLRVLPSPILMAVHAPTKLRGTPSTEQFTPQQLESFLVERDMKFRVIRAVTNEYVTTSGTKITLQLGLINVSRTKKFDPNGDPQYLVNAQAKIEMNVPTVDSGTPSRRVTEELQR